MTATKTEKFAWNETNAATAISMYEGIIASDGLEVANSQGLIDIAKAVGAESHVKVRSKLVSAKVYQKSDKPRKVGGGSSLRKAHYVRVLTRHAIEDGLIEDADGLASLEQMKLDQLDVIARMVGVQDEVKESAGE